MKISNPIKNFFEKRKQQKENEELSIDFHLRKIEIMEQNKKELIESFMNNPHFMEAATRNVNLPPFIVAQNLVENLKKGGCVDELYRPKQLI